MGFIPSKYYLINAGLATFNFRWNLILDYTVFQVKFRLFSKFFKLNKCRIRLLSDVEIV